MTLHFFVFVFRYRSRPYPTNPFTPTHRLHNTTLQTDRCCDTGEGRLKSCKIHLAATFFSLTAEINCIITCFRLEWRVRREKCQCQLLPAQSPFSTLSLFSPPLCGNHLLIHPEKLRLRGDISGVIWHRGTRRGEIDGFKSLRCYGQIHMVIPPYCPCGNRGFL